jgi:hypothetical protein
MCRQPILPGSPVTPPTPPAFLSIMKLGPRHADETKPKFMIDAERGEAGEGGQGSEWVTNSVVVFAVSSITSAVRDTW